MKPTLLDRWLDELVMCGGPRPITRRQAIDEMVADGWDRTAAVNVLCWYKAIEPQGVAA